MRRVLECGPATVQLPHAHRPWPGIEIMRSCACVTGCVRPLWLVKTAIGNTVRRASPCEHRLYVHVYVWAAPLHLLLYHELFMRSAVALPAQHRARMRVRGAVGGRVRAHHTHRPHLDIICVTVARALELV